MHQLRRQASFTLDRFSTLAEVRYQRFWLFVFVFSDALSAKSRVTICSCFQFPASFQLEPLSKP